MTETDRRLLRSNGRVAHSSLRGAVEAERFAEGTARVVTRETADIRRAPGGARDRQMLFGEVFHVLEDVDGTAFGYAARDGYVGYVASDALGTADGDATHVVAVRLSQALTQPDFKREGETLALSLGSRVRVTGDNGRWREIAAPGGQRLFLPATHLRPLGTPETDPVEVAARLIGTPYVWGGNSAMGIDCSGLAQAGFLACGIPCPGDSDLQEARFGETLAPGTAPERGDLLFWKGHVALVADRDTILHANAHHMAVAYEGLTEAIARIAAQDGGPVTRHARR
ncbi:NlpC/P60 family protein [uncultured Salipiger sp.]|uniref:C40 family peptidase n=1 Tax=uncultured Salipiger sp. TaxID=499810 RepID=UPI0025959BCF|nr:NlpC/P60 family protein [uncultured Salipiger sp.]